MPYIDCSLDVVQKLWNCFNLFLTSWKDRRQLNYHLSFIPHQIHKKVQTYKHGTTVYSHLAKLDIPNHYRTQMFTTMLTKAHYQNQSCSNIINFTPLHHPKDTPIHIYKCFAPSVFIPNTVWEIIFPYLCYKYISNSNIS